MTSSKCSSTSTPRSARSRRRGSPKLALGEVTFLEVTAVTSIGAFVDWGLGKELLVPFAEQIRGARRRRAPPDRPLPRQERPPRRHDVRHRHARRTCRVDVERDEWIDGEAWRNDPDIGLFAILERSFVGLVPASEPHRLSRGEAARFRVAHILPDGKLVLSLRGSTRTRSARATPTNILAVLSRADPPRVGDRSDPESIRALFGLSKKAFKRAVGGLLKLRKVELDERGFIVMMKPPAR